MSSLTASLSLVSSGTGTTTRYTDEELDAMCDKAELDNIYSRCLSAYWDNDRFKDSLIDAPERLQAAFDVLLGWIDQRGPQEALQRLREASEETV